MVGSAVAGGSLSGEDGLLVDGCDEDGGASAFVALVSLAASFTLLASTATQPPTIRTKPADNAAVGLTNFLRSPSAPGNQPVEGEDTLGQRFRKLANQLARAWGLACGRDTLADLRSEAKFYEEVRVWMAKFDAQERQASGRPVPEEVQRLLSKLVASSTATGQIVDIYDAAGLPSRRCPTSDRTSN